MNTDLKTHKIKCPSCGNQTGVTLAVNLLGTEGIINCFCSHNFAYKVTTKYEILTATVNEFKDNQL